MEGYNRRTAESRNEEECVLLMLVGDDGKDRLVCVLACHWQRMACAMGPQFCQALTYWPCRARVLESCGTARSFAVR